MSEDRGPDWKGYGVSQALVEQWVRSRFTDKVFENKEEHGRRVLEEAIELFKVEARDPKEARAQAHKLVDAVFDKKVGELKQEIGGVAVTLLALCALHDLRLDELAEAEINRIMTTPAEEFRKKQQAKADNGLAVHLE